MQSKIRILDEHTINKIAAGEVIENPGSVVKELIENSIDAGASEICVEIQEGGRQLIRISDNGCGMGEDDALLCLERHATSKLREVEDMETLMTMGFRGEAIPSIAAISKFMLLTSISSKDQQGTLILVEGGKVLRCTQASRSKGTTIEVKSLFFNVPVRRKFQKSPTSDANEILRVLTIQSLAHPHIQFELISDHKTLLKTPASSQVSFEKKFYERIRDVLGHELTQEICLLNGENEICKIAGYVGLPSASRPNRLNQFLFINQRAVQCPAITNAIRESYGTALATNRHPLFILHLNLQGSLIDVNVHPQKREVRIRQEHLIKDLLVTCMHKVLQQNDITLSTIDNPPFPSPSISVFEPPIEKNHFNPPSPISFGGFMGGDYFDHSIFEEIQIQSQSKEPAPPPQLPLPAFEAEKKPVPKVIATLKGYLLAENQEELMVIDQRGAHSRILFEKLFTKPESLEIQSFLIPYTIETTPVESAILQNYLIDLNAMGIQIKEFGPSTFVVEGVSPLFSKTPVKSLMEELLESLFEANHAQLFKQEKEKQLARLASQASIHSNQKLTLEEAQTLIRQLWECNAPHYCPFGKSIMVPLSRDEIARQFQK